MLDSDEITRVLIGYNVSNDLRNNIAKMCKNKGIEVCVTYVNPYQYSVKFMELEKYNKLINRIWIGEFEDSV